MMMTIAIKPAAMTAAQDAGHISWEYVERQQMTGENRNVQMLTWELCLQKHLSYTVSQLMNTEGFNNINSLRLTMSWGCKNNGASFHLHLYGCFSEHCMWWRQGVVFWSSGFASSMVFSSARQTAATAVFCWCCILYGCSFCAWKIKCPVSSNSLALLQQH